MKRTYPMSAVFPGGRILRTAVEMHCVSIGARVKYALYHRYRDAMASMGGRWGERDFAHAGGR